VLSNYECRGLAPNLSYESGRGLLCELDPSLWNRPRGINDGELTLLEADRRRHGRSRTRTVLALEWIEMQRLRLRWRIERAGRRSAAVLPRHGVRERDGHE
jgi:hypothetical protein